MSLLLRTWDEVEDFRFGFDLDADRILEVRRDTGHVTTVAPEVTYIAYDEDYYIHGFWYWRHIIDTRLFADFLRAHADLLVDDDGDGVATMPDAYVHFPKWADTRTSFTGTDADEYISPDTYDGQNINAAGGDDVLFIGVPYEMRGAWGVQSRAHGGEGDDLLVSGMDGTVLFGDAGDDVLISGDARTGRPRKGSELYGGDGADDLSTGSSVDTLYGGAGDDIYRFELGDRDDRVKDADGGNLIVFGEGVALEDLAFTRSGTLLTVFYGNAPDDSPNYVRIEGFYTTADADLPWVGAGFGDLSFVDEGGETRHSLVDLVGGVQAERIGQAGIVEVAQARRGDAVWVAFDAPIENAVVVLGAMTRNGLQAATSRVIDVTDEGFFLRIDEWAYMDGRHLAEEISWMAVSAGSWLLPSGDQLQTGRTQVDSKWTSAGSDAGLAGGASVFSTVQGEAEATPVTTRVRHTAEAAFQLRLQEEEGSDHLHPEETVNWIAVEHGAAAVNDIDRPFESWRREIAPGLDPETAVDGDYDEHVFAQSFAQSYGSRPALFAALQTFYGRNPANVRLTDWDETGFAAFVQEEQSRDDELNHKPEGIGWAAFAEGAIMGFSADATLL
ncbi:calcium-binding protein [Albimonas sp. CAU 1670]|uniref:calcium-binding protein n=1 Tax=Albimonas sp. CAU 1670 TaxID=3032599 RepID=UPI0023D9A9E6|nr:calcium-binding protein [Albimonas sp. CAU 1670]MDF2234831.1 calcium-binding protein [Albimonas sp. CAU 1670]